MDRRIYLTKEPIPRQVILVRSINGTGCKNCVCCATAPTNCMKEIPLNKPKPGLIKGPNGYVQYKEVKTRTIFFHFELAAVL